MNRKLSLIAGLLLLLFVACTSESTSPAEAEGSVAVDPVAETRASEEAASGDVNELVTRYVSYKYGGAFLGGGNPYVNPFWDLRAKHDGPMGEVLWVVDTFQIVRVMALDDTAHVARVRYPRAVQVAHPGYVGELRRDLDDHIVISGGLIHSYDEMIVGYDVMKRHIDESDYKEDDWQERIDTALRQLHR